MAESQNIEYKESWRDEYLKWICGFANAQGGKLYIGINDKQQVVGVANSHHLLEDIPNKIVTTLGIVCDVNLLKEGESEYIEIIVEPSNMPIAYKGEYHLRSGATKQQLRGVALQQFILKKMGLSWDNVAMEKATIEEIDRNAVNYFLLNAVDAKRMPKESLNDTTEEVISNLDLMTDDGYVKNAAILLFGKHPEKYIPSVEFKIGRFGASESDLWFQDVVKGNILQMADKVIELLRAKYLISPIEYKGLQRIEPLEIPEDVLREAIFNAIVHKDYTGSAIQMKVYTDHIELWNEGMLPEGFTLDNLLGKHRSRPRNRKIANVFYLAGFIEAWGRGINKIMEGLSKAGLREAHFEEDCGGLSVTIYRKSIDEMFNMEHNKLSNRELSKRENEVLSLLSSNASISITEISKLIGVSYKTIQRELDLLREIYNINWVGPKRTGHWEITRK